MSEMYTDPCYGVKMTHIFPLGQRPSATGPALGYATGGHGEPNFFRMPFKAQLNKIGIVVKGASAIGCSTTTGFHLQMISGTILATFVPGSSSLASRSATGVAPETATRIAKNRVVVPHVREVAIASAIGTVYHFMEYQRVYDGGT